MSIFTEVTVEEESVESARRPGEVVPVLTVVTSALNEEGNVHRFLDEVSVALESLGVPGEVLFFDDGSRDGTSEAVADYVRRNRELVVRMVRHEQPQGLSSSINEAIHLAHGQFVCFIPADLESLPSEDVPKLYEAMTDEVDVVLGCRVGRGDGKLVASWLYKQLNRWLFGINVKDGNWLKMIRRKRLAGLRLDNDWHPFLAALLAHRGCRFAEVETAWHARQHGSSKFGLKRIPKSLAAALSVKLHLRFGTRPWFFFLSTATCLFGASGLLLLLSLWLYSGGGWLPHASLVFSATFFLAGWISAVGGLMVDILSRKNSDSENGTNISR